MFFLSLILASFARAACLDAAIAQEIAREFSLPFVQSDLCDENRDSHKLLSALNFLKTTPLPPANSPLSKNIVPENGWEFLRARVSSFVNEPTCALGQMAFVRSQTPGVAHLCPSFFDGNLTLVERLPTLLHEAHHFDGDNFAHVNCSQGRLKGMRNACDPSLGYGGGYAVETEVLLKLSRLSDRQLTPALRARAKNMALARAAENFNEAVAPYKLETIYLLGKSEAYLLNPEDGSLWPAPVLNTEKLRLVSRGASFAAIPRNGDDAYMLDTLSLFRPLPVEGEVLVNYNKLARAERPDVLAILNEEKFSGSVSSNRISVAFETNFYETQIDLPFWAKAVYTPGEFGSSDLDVLYLADEEGLVHPIRLKSGRTYEILPTVPFPAGFRSFTLFQGKRYALRDDGALAVFENGEWKNLPGLESRRFQFVSRAFYWAPFLAE